MKKVVIIRTTGSELSNQLWNYISVYAYSLERKVMIENYSFFEYGNYFTIPAPNLFLKLFFFFPFTNYIKRKTSFKRRLWRKMYECYIKLFIIVCKWKIIYSDNAENKPFYLPPTKENQELSILEKTCEVIYFDGWLFRNPIGINKYRKEIISYLRPRQDIRDGVAMTIKKLKQEFKYIVGVHIRQGDYLVWRGGTYFIQQARVREILDEYIKANHLNKDQICFVITSDGKVDTEIFSDLNISLSKENAVYDLFLLSSTDTIIGSNSTFGAFASYYGNIPFIVMQKEDIDWDYYSDKKSYFENKYSTMVHY